nr:hypothetical protein [Tanacetum cinerariifolium]
SSSDGLKPSGEEEKKDVEDPWNEDNEGNPQQDWNDKGIIDSGCSRHMTKNRSYLINYEEINGGFVVFGGNSRGKITGKDFKLTDESYILLKVPRKDNMYIVDLKNFVPQGGLTCLFAKTTSDESNHWPVVVGNQSNGSADTKSCDNVGEEENKDVEDPGNEDSEVSSTKEPRVNQEKDSNVNITNNINAVSPTDNAACIKDNAVDENIVYGSADDPNIPNLEEIDRFYDVEDDDSGADLKNLDTNF